MVRPAKCGDLIASEKHKRTVRVQVCMAQIYSIKFFIALFPYRLKMQDIFEKVLCCAQFKKKNTKAITRIYDIFRVLNKKHH